MNNRKLIFWIIWALLIIILLSVLIFAKWDTRKKGVAKSSWDFKIWIVWDSAKNFEEFISSFKEDNKSMANVIYSIQSFPNYEEYSNALTSAIIKWVAPDIFVLNNNEESIFEEKVLALSNSDIDIHNFRKEHKNIFNNDLIVSQWEWNEKQEFLKWIPVWYETLWIFFNKWVPFRLNATNFTSLSSLLGIIEKKKEDNLVTIGIWNWNVLNAWDILAQYLLINKIKSLDDSKYKSWLSEYTTYGSLNWDNLYNSLFENWENNIDLFIDKKIGSIIAYPRVIEKLQTSWFSKQFLYATPFPHRFSWDGPSLANYNYFVINKETSQEKVALTFLKYLNSKEWAENYLAKYKYYLPAKIELEEKLWEWNISNYFQNIQLRDFYSDEPLSSFNKWNKVIYDKEIISVLNNFNSYLSAFEKFKTSTLCKSNKILNLTNLSVSCD
jgi:hypothetical protein